MKSRQTPSGLAQADAPFERLQDPEAIKNWPETLGRDGARTPLPWRADAVNAGFGDGEPWLPLGADHARHAVDVQERDPASVLNFTRQCVALRRSCPAMQVGTIHFPDAPESLLVFERTHGDSRALCVINLGMKAERFTPAGKWRLALGAGVESLSQPIMPGGGYIALPA